MSPPAVTEAVPAPALRDALYMAAFPDEDLTGLVSRLLALPSGVVSLCVDDGGALRGHALFTLCDLEDGGRAALLGPLAVAPAHQRRGVGSALIGAGLAMMRGRGARRVLVLGDPAYYGRFGFEPERAIRPTHPIPDGWREAWRSIRLTEAPASGRLLAPEPWDDPALWR